MTALVVDPTLVQDAWQVETTADLDRTLAAQKRFFEAQPAVAAYVLAVADDQAIWTQQLCLLVARVIDRVYTRARGGAPLPVEPDMMEAVAEEVEQALEGCETAEPEFANEQLLHRFRFAAPEILGALWALLADAEQQDAKIADAVGVALAVSIAIARAYDRAGGYDVTRTLAAGVEAISGRSLGKIGRNDPCPCGSGKKFKKCCWDTPSVAPPPLSRGDVLFDASMRCVQRVWSRLFELEGDRDARWLRDRLDELTDTYRPGEPGGVPDSMFTSYGLFDVVLPRRKKTFGELLLQREGRQCDDAERARWQRLCTSYPGFYEVVECCSDGTKILRELGTDQRWHVYDITDPDNEGSATGDQWLTRLVGTPEEAVTLMAPLVWPLGTGMDLMPIVSALMRAPLVDGLLPAAALRAGMKEGGVVLAEFVCRTSPDADADDETE